MPYPDYQNDFTHLGILIGNARSFNNSSSFPTIGTLGVRYYDSTSNLYYDWSPVEQAYVLANSNSYANLGAFPAVGVVGALYYAENTGIYYQWSPTLSAYILGSSAVFPSASSFPLLGAEGVHYLAQDTGIYWQWSPVYNKYITYHTSQIGFVYSFAGLVAPDRHLILDGSAFNITTYPELHAVFLANWQGYTAGVLPDMRNKFIRAKNASRAIGHFEASAIHDHGHSGSADFTLPSISTGTVIGNDNGLYRGNRGFLFQQPTTLNNGGSVSINPGGVTGATVANETRPDNVAMNFIICAKDFKAI